MCQKCCNLKPWKNIIKIYNIKNKAKKQLQPGDKCFAEAGVTHKSIHCDRKVFGAKKKKKWQDNKKKHGIERKEASG